MLRLLLHIHGWIPAVILQELRALRKVGMRILYLKRKIFVGFGEHGALVIGTHELLVESVSVDLAIFFVGHGTEGAI